MPDGDFCARCHRRRGDGRKDRKWSYHLGVTLEFRGLKFRLADQCICRRCGEYLGMLAKAAAS